MRGLKPPQRRPKNASTFAAQVRAISGTSGVTGSGTVGQLAKWTGTHTLGDGGTAGGGGSVSGLYWAPPAVANSRDEEFDGDLSAWTAASTPIGGVDPGLYFDTATEAADSFRADCNVRPSWLRLQAVRQVGEVQPYAKALSALPSDWVAWTRVAVTWDGDSHNANALAGMLVQDSTSGNFAAIYFDKDVVGSSGSGTSKAIGRVRVAGVDSWTSAVTQPAVHPAFTWSLMAIQVRSGTAYLWVGTDAGTWRLVGSLSISGTFDGVSLMAGSGTWTTTVPNPVTCYDFVRFVEGTDLPF